ncbi:MAG TPA: tetraacyldisaccharide 4'-kinase, partial [Rhodocyclaceae bacterium]|nr:tetraacyldisaccharide 4'-kinase [Rhodocyclaceae bacterium]
HPYRLGQPQARMELAALRGRPVHAVAGIGHPARFFATLRAQGLEVIEHPFPDHHAFSAADLDFGPDAVIVMTEKDAVKCAGLTSHQTWVLPVTADLPPALIDTLLEKLHGH